MKTFGEYVTIGARRNDRASAMRSVRDASRISVRSSTIGDLLSPGRSPRAGAVSIDKAAGSTSG
jgi:hypothetical protein